MKIIEQSHEILMHTGIELLETAGRTCYQSEPKGCSLTKNMKCLKYPGMLQDPVCDDKDCKHHSTQKFVKMLKDKGHDAMILVASVTGRGAAVVSTQRRTSSLVSPSPFKSQVPSSPSSVITANH